MKFDDKKQCPKSKVKSSYDYSQNISKYINKHTSVNQKYEDFCLSLVS